MQPNGNGTILLWILMTSDLEHLLGVKHTAAHHQYRQGLVTDPSVQLLLLALVSCTTRKMTGKEQQEVPMKKSEITHSVKRPTSIVAGHLVLLYGFVCTVY
jgi:hypothetical protein